MTPQLQQAIKLLQLSSLELEQEIQEALYSNPMLEMEEEEQSAPPEKPAEETPDASDTIPTELSVDADWDDIYQPPAKPPASSDSEFDAENFHTVTESLQDHLLWQLHLTQLSTTDKMIGAAIIDAINDEGRLTQPPAEIWGSLEQDDIEVDEVVAVLHCIQQFDPPGVAATDLQECLLIQLGQLDPSTPFLPQALTLTKHHLPLVARKDLAKLQKASHLQEEDIQAAIALIQTLNPHPGSSIGSDDNRYITPDVSVIKREDRWLVSLNTDFLPRISLNQQYINLVRRSDRSEDGTFLRQQLQEAKWFLRSLEGRNETLLRVAQCIVEVQVEFLERGAEAMKPMVLADIAEKLELHESTISRVTTQKYIDTPQGIYELKYFFSSHVSTTAGGECSSTAIRAILQRMIKDEDPAKPLSDSKLAILLQKQGIEIARRTVAKYREGLHIPSSSQRKQFKR